MKIGKFYISRHLVEEKYKLHQALAKMEFVPTRVELTYHQDRFEYIGLSKLFRDLEEAEVVPEYLLTIETDNDRNITTVQAMEVKS